MGVGSGYNRLSLKGFHVKLGRHFRRYHSHNVFLPGHVHELASLVIPNRHVVWIHSTSGGTTLRPQPRTIAAVLGSEARNSTSNIRLIFSAGAFYPPFRL